MENENHVVAGQSGCIIRRPPLVSFVRVNILAVDMVSALKQIKICVENENSAKYIVAVHPVLPDVITISAAAHHQSALSQPDQSVISSRLRIYVDHKAGAAIMRGAHLYAKGILASDRSWSADSECEVFMVYSGKVLRGQYMSATPRPTTSDVELVYLGSGRVKYSREDIFITNTAPDGMGVEMVDRVYNNASLSGVHNVSWCTVQQLSSVLCSYVLDPQPNERVLDMCAAPGGKSSHIAVLMLNQGELHCVDRHRARVQQLQTTMSTQQLTCAQVHQANSCHLINQHTSTNTQNLACPPFIADSFDRVLLDAPCSALGQRPLCYPIPNTNTLNAHVNLQRKLIAEAVRLVRPGGVFVYSTCSIYEGENDQQVNWLLNKWPHFHLLPVPDHLAHFDTSLNKRPGILRFDARSECALHTQGHCLQATEPAQTLFATCKRDHDHTQSRSTPVHNDTIGFFMAKFIRELH